jgi:putative tryptophan/tyrosine transport system substrate-binding protein
MRRREFIAGLGGAAVWQVDARAQQHKPPVVAFVAAGSADTLARAFFKGLSETGYTEGRNVTVEQHWVAGGHL